MSTHDNAPPPEGWGCERRPCPIPCRICTPPEPPTEPLGNHIELGSN